MFYHRTLVWAVVTLATGGIIAACSAEPDAPDLDEERLGVAEDAAKLGADDDSDSGGDADSDSDSDSSDDCDLACENNCDALAADLLVQCDAFIAQNPNLPISPTFCADGVAVVQATCDAGCCPAPAPGDCTNNCAAVADATFDACGQSSPPAPPGLCDSVGQLTFDTCVQVFQCCDSACFDQANADLATCMQNGGTAGMECEGITPNVPPGFASCLIAAQKQLNECIWEEDDDDSSSDDSSDSSSDAATCLDQGSSCQLTCNYQAALAFTTCIDQPLCQDPNVCGGQAQQQEANCIAACP